MLHNTMLETRCLVKPKFLWWGKKYVSAPMLTQACKLIRSAHTNGWMRGFDQYAMDETDMLMASSISNTVMEALKWVNERKTYNQKMLASMPYVAVFLETAKDFRRFNVRVYLYHDCMGNSRGVEIADKVFDFRPGARQNGEEEQ